MDVLRMLEHCARFDEWVLGVGRHDYRQSLLGRMSEEQIGRFAYKHADHHLRQFGC